MSDVQTGQCMLAARLSSMDLDSRCRRGRGHGTFPGIWIHEATDDEPRLGVRSPIWVLRPLEQHAACQSPCRLSFLRGLERPDLVVKERLQFLHLCSLELGSLCWSHSALREVVLVFLEGFGVSLFGDLAHLASTNQRLLDIITWHTPFSHDP